MLERGGDAGRGLGVAPPFSAFASHNSVFLLVYSCLADVGTKFFDRFEKEEPVFCGRSIEWNRATLRQRGMNSGSPVRSLLGS